VDNIDLNNECISIISLDKFNNIYCDNNYNNGFLDKFDCEINYKNYYALTVYQLIGLCV